MLQYNWETALDWWVPVVSGLHVTDGKVIFKVGPLG